MLQLPEETVSTSGGSLQKTGPWVAFDSRVYLKNTYLERKKEERDIKMFGKKEKDVQNEIENQPKEQRKKLENKKTQNRSNCTLTMTLRLFLVMRVIKEKKNIN